MGLGSSFLLTLRDIGYIRKYIVAVVFIVFSLSFSWYYVRDYFNINNRAIVEAGAAVDRLTPKDARVIAVYNGDTSFLYQTKRKGWASQEKDFSEMIQMGASYLALVNPTKQDLNLGKEFQIIDQTKDYIIFDLLKKP